MTESFSSVGKQIRLNRIFREDGKATMVAINQAISMGPAKGMEDVRALLTKLMSESPDSITIHRGMAMSTADIFAGKSALILKATNSTRFFYPDETVIASVEDAVALGADAVSIGLTLADKNEQATLKNSAAIISVANKEGMPTVAHAYPNGDLISDDVRYNVENVGYATRIALEIGVDIIKTFWTGSADTFEKIVKIGAPAKVVISGGPRCETLRKCFDMTWQGMQAGAHGITYGRNIWQHEYPDAVLCGLNAIIHDGATVKQAMEAASEKAKVKLI